MSSASDDAFYGSIEERVKRNKEVAERHEEWLEEHDGRLTALEKSKYILYGAVAMLMMVLGNVTLSEALGGLI